MYETKNCAQTDGIGLVLEGRALRGIFTAGVLDYIMEQGLWSSYVVGVSAGACNLLGYVSRQIGYTKACMTQEDAKKHSLGINQLITSGKIINSEKTFCEYPHSQLSFDYKTYFASDIQNELVVTNCATGKAEYLHEDHDELRLGTLGKASGSVPLFTEMVELDGKRYLEGGLADSIPVERAIERGCLQNVVILTCRKGVIPSLTSYQKILYQKYYREYPNLVKTILNYPMMYKNQLTRLDSLEKDGKVFVIRPEIPEIKRFETNYDALYSYYKHGYQIAAAKWSVLQNFLQHATRVVPHQNAP